MATVYANIKFDPQSLQYYSTTHGGRHGWYDEVWANWNNTTYSTSLKYTATANTTNYVTDYDYVRNQLAYYNYIQKPIWEQWERAVVRERETEEQAAQRLLRIQEQEDEIQRRREEASARRLAEAERMEGAHKRGLDLLNMLLTPEERMYRIEHPETIMVRGSNGGMFLIEERGVHGNVIEVDEHGCRLGRICVAPKMYDAESRLALPNSDGWVGQYLAIKHQEQVFRDTGNWSGRRPCAHPEVATLGERRAA